MIKEAIPFKSPSAPSEGQTSARSEAALDLELAVQDVDSVLEQLASLAVAIRRSGSTTRMQKADRTFDPSKHPELQRHLTLFIAFQSPSQIEQLRVARRSQSPTSGPAFHLDTVQERLITANLRRRHRFLYAQRHASKLERHTQEYESSLRNATKLHANQVAEASELEAEDNVTSKTTQTGIEFPTIPKGVLTNTTASEVVTPIRYSIPRRTAPSQQARTEISTTASKLVYPTGPEIKPSASTFQCPCCCMPLLSDVAIQSNKWRSVHAFVSSMHFLAVLTKL